MSGVDILPRRRMCLLLSVENWEWVYNRIRDAVEKHAVWSAASRNPLPGSVLRNLGDRFRYRRNVAALEVQKAVRKLYQAHEQPKISDIIVELTDNFALSPVVNRRKGGVIALANAAVGLAPLGTQYLKDIVPPIINSSTHDDGRVRFYACEALHIIAREWKDAMIEREIFSEIFDVLYKLSTDIDPAVQEAAHLFDRRLQTIVTQSDQFSVEEVFIPLLTERINAQHPKERLFLLGWITALDAATRYDMLSFLPNFLDGSFNMLCDGNQESREQASKLLTDFLERIKESPSREYGRIAVILIKQARSSHASTRLNAMKWINEFRKLEGDQLGSHYAGVLGVVFSCISDSDEEIKVVAREINEWLRSVMEKPCNDIGAIGAILAIVRRKLMSVHETTKLEALRWIFLLLKWHREKVPSSTVSFFNGIFPPWLRYPSAEIARLVEEIRATIT